MEYQESLGVHTERVGQCKDLHIQPDATHDGEDRMVLVNQDMMGNLVEHGFSSAMLVNGPNDGEPIYMIPAQHLEDLLLHSDKCINPHDKQHVERPNKPHRSKRFSS